MNKQTSVISLVSLIFGGVAIACTLILLFQNLQPLVTVYFLGQFTIPIPLSLAVLAAFLIGGLSAFIINLISFWISPRINSEAEFEEEDYEEPPAPKSTPKQKPAVPPKDDTVKYGSNYDEDYDDEDDVIDVKYLDR
jgi:uncharacterized integral membrane protein